MNIFKQFWLSLYSPKDIAKFRFQGIGKTILYVFLLIFISVLPTFIYSTTSINEGVSSFQEAIKNEIPDFEIKNGKLYTEANEPVIHTDEKFDIFFDGTGTLTAENIENQSENAFALLESEMVVVTNGTMQAQSYSLFEGFTISHKDILSFMEQMDSLLIIFVVIMGIVTFIFASGMKFIEISFLAMLATLLVNSFNPKLQYRHLWRIIAYCVTLPTVFFTLMAFLQTNVIGGIYVKWGVTFTMLYLVVKEIPRPKANK